MHKSKAMKFSQPPSFFLLLIIAAVLRHSTAAPSYPKHAQPHKSGYLEVNPKTGSSIYYTYYEAQNPIKNTPISKTPILIWLEGGPGCSAMTANYYQIGPWIVDQNITLKPNPGPWNNLFGLLFLDNPIGTGFSIAASNEEIPRNQNDVARHLYIAIMRFFDLHKGFKSRPIYLTGHSYAGKYIPALGYYLLKKNLVVTNDSRVNLAGVAIGNALLDPELQVMTHAENTYQLGLINDKQKTLLEGLQMETVEYVKSCNWSEAIKARNRVLGTLGNMTGLATLLDFTKLTPYQDSVVDKFLNHVEIKRVIGARESIVFQGCSRTVLEAMKEDVMKSVRYMVEFLVKETRVMLYQGNCDLLDGVVSNMAWIKRMKWDGIQRFMEAERKVWTVDGKLAGYVQKWGSLSNVVVMNAGHLVPSDQHVNSQVMIQDWVLERGLFGGVENEGIGFSIEDSMDSSGCPSDMFRL